MKKEITFYTELYNKIDSGLNCWHPLYKYIVEVKWRYLWINNWKSEGLSNRFSDWLECIKDFGYFEDAEALLKIFEPLIINQDLDSNMTLFKYKGYIDLSELGYGSDFFDLYDGLYRECRSIVFDLGTPDKINSTKVLLASMSKFKNYGEDEALWSERRCKAKILEAVTVDYMDKMDGSYQQYCGILFKDEGYIVGSGSQAINPKESWRLHNGFEILSNNQKGYNYEQLLKDYSTWTFQFEYCAPENQVVVKYTEDQTGLYLFNARNNLTGQEMSVKDLQRLSKAYNVPIVQVYDYQGIDDVLRQLKDFKSDEKEGWVIKCTDRTGKVFRVKVKCDDYVLIHKALSRMVSPNAIIASIDQGNIDDFYSKIPSNYKDICLGIRIHVELYLKMMNEQVDNWYGNVIDEISAQYPGITMASEQEFRKNFMVIMKEIVPKDFQGAVINKFLNRPNYFLRRAGWTEKAPGYIKYGEILEFLKKYNYLD